VTLIAVAYQIRPAAHRGAQGGRLAVGVNRSVTYWFTALSMETSPLLRLSGFSSSHRSTRFKRPLRTVIASWLLGRIICPARDVCERMTGSAESPYHVVEVWAFT